MPTTPRPADEPTPRPPSLGRDEMNLAEFPISVVTKIQPREKDGRKLEEISYESSIYDPTTRRRIPQRVTLSTRSRIGLPTPADESVVLALLHLAKKTNDFQEPLVYFVPRQLFLIMRWAPNSRSYDRLKSVLARLKALDIRYENAWWDADGREYEEVFATGIIAEYAIRKPKNLKHGETTALSFVHWAPAFFKSLARENIKKLDLELYFSLRLPTSQRMYRFLDKRFYTSSVVELDLKDFACGHIGLTDPGDNGLLKHRLASAIAELERIGFIAAATPTTRYKKVKTGIWRVRFEPGSKRPTVEPKLTAQSRQTVPGAKVAPSSTPESELVAAFYQLWSPTTPPSEQAVSQARDLIEKHGSELVQNWLPRVVKRMRSEFPDAKHFGAALPFFADIAQEHEERQQHQRRLDNEARQRRAEKEQAEQREAEERVFDAKWRPVWASLPAEQQTEIRSVVLQAHPGFNGSDALRRSHIVTRLCLQELANRSEASQNHVADGPQTA